MRIIFLDIDGVLNSEEFYRSQPETEEYKQFDDIDESKVSLLKEIVDATHALIVLSSTWRNLTREGRTNEIADNLYTYLEETLSKYGLHIESHTPQLGENRPLEIKSWLNSAPDVTAFVSLDDDFTARQYARYGLDKHLVKTSFYGERGGLQPEHVQQAIDILGGHIK